ncbi:MAG: hypothetical protein AAF346_00035 [Pseudomonadota bacterium]
MAKTWKITNHEEYLEARAELDRINKAIAEAPKDSVPVFKGSAELHTEVQAWERRNSITHPPPWMKSTQ